MCGALGCGDIVTWADNFCPPDGPVSFVPLGLNDYDVGNPLRGRAGSTNLKNLGLIITRFV